MAEITPLMKAAYGHLPHLVPPEVRNQIDDAEFLDRLVYAEHCLKSAQENPMLAKGWRQEAYDVLTSRPREDSGRDRDSTWRRSRMFEDRGMPDQAEQVLRQARGAAGNCRAPERTFSLYFGSNPAHDAARAAMRKGAKPVFDAAGHLLGVVDPARINPAGRG